MAASRGTADPSTPVSAPPPSSQTSTEKRALAGESSALASARRNLSYLIDPSSSKAAPTRLRTRALLRSLRYLGVFLYWRAVRWAKYAIVGSLVAAVGSFALAGSLASGVGFFIAPTGLLASIAVGTVWGVGRWGWRWTWRRWERRRGGGKDRVGGAVVEDRVGGRGMRPEPELMPW